MNLIQTLHNQAKASPERPALLDIYRGKQRSLSYEQLWQRVCGGAAQLEQTGLKSGDTIAFLHPVSIELYEGLLSCLHAGMRAMFFDPSADPRFVNHCLQIAQPKAFFASPKAHLLRIKFKALRQTPIKLHTGSFLPFTKQWNPQETHRECTPVQADTHALITFTSGSTGQPKAILRTHQFLLEQHQALEKAIDLQAGEIDLITLPVFVLANLASGMTSVLADSDLAKPAQADANKIHQQLTQTKATRCAASPAFFEALSKKPEVFSKLKTLYTGGAPVFPSLLDRLHQCNSETNLVTVYGSSEAEPIAHISYIEISPEDRLKMLQGKGLLVGKPVPEIEIAIIKDQHGKSITPLTEDEFERLKLSPYQAGEIVVSGKHVLKGYLNGVGDEETKFKVDETIWHRTGDAGQWDEKGRLFLLGRCKAKLPAKGALPEIYPFSIECAVSEFTEITRSAAISHNNRRTLILEASYNASLLTKLKGSLEWAGIENWKFVKKIPVDKRHNAKVDYEKLVNILKSGLR